MTRFNVTVETVTPESAEHGDCSDRGFVSKNCSIHAALAALGFTYSGRRQSGLGFEDSGSWFSTIDPERDYRTGSETTYAIHPPRTITKSSYRRLARLLTGGTRS